MLIFYCDFAAKTREGTTTFWPGKHYVQTDWNKQTCDY